MTESYTTARPAATVVVIREGDEKPEVFMARRHSKAVFASHYVFPGGILEPADSDVHGMATGVTASDANAMLGTTDGALEYYSAAIREAFEESSVLLARRPDGRWAFCDGDADQQASHASRDQLNAGEISWADFLATNELRPAYDSLHYIAYWVTPRARTKRFSTRFFLAVMPDGQSAVHDDGELTDSCWMTADEVIAAGKRGDMKLMFPTIATLRDIAKYDTVGEVVDWARETSRSGIAKLLPAFVVVDGEERIVMPGSPHYPADHES